MKHALSFNRRSGATHRVIAILGLALFTHFATPLQAAAPPTKMSFQSFLTDDNGGPLSDNVTIKFDLFDAASGGSSQWTETLVTTVSDGHFSVILGEATPLSAAAFVGERYMQLTVDSSVLSPRLRMLSAPFAFVAEQANSVVDGSVESASLAANSVTLSKMADDSVGAAEIKADAVGSSEIASGAVGTPEIADNAVTNEKIKANAVTESKLANDSVGATEIKANAVGSSEIAADAVGSSEIASGAVGSSEIASSAVTNVKLGVNSVTQDKLADNSVGTAEIKDDAVTHEKIHVPHGDILTLGGDLLIQGTATLGNDNTTVQTIRGKTVLNSGTETQTLRLEGGGTTAEIRLGTLGVDFNEPSQGGFLFRDRIRTLSSDKNKLGAFYTHLAMDVRGSSSDWTLATADDSSGATHEALYFFFGSHTKAILRTDGTWVTTSDRRLKKNISKLQPGVLDRVCRLPAVSFQMKDSENDGQWQTGFIAQDVEKEFPNMVATDPQGVRGLSYDRFGVLSIAAIQELRKDTDKKVSVLQAENEKLRTRNTELKQQFDNVLSRLQALESRVK